MIDYLGVWVVLGPESDELPEVVGAEDGPVPEHQSRHPRNIGGGSLQLRIDFEKPVPWGYKVKKQIFADSCILFVYFMIYRAY